MKIKYKVIQDIPLLMLKKGGILSPHYESGDLYKDDHSYYSVGGFLDYRLPKRIIENNPDYFEKIN